VVKDDVEIEVFHDTVRNATSARMELMGFIEALRYTDEDCVIHCDNQYVVKGYNSWLKFWLANNWKKSDGKEIKNRDLWETIAYLKSDNKKAQWLKGHVGHKWNERADSLTRNY
jgi:ribonuclease HI